jgi:dCMP deaminase
MLILAVGIVRVVCEKRYHAAEETREMFRSAGVSLEVRSDEVQGYARPADAQLKKDPTPGL